MAAVFRANGDGTFDLEVDGRAAEYDVDPEDFASALRRRRVEPTEVYVEDETGYRSKLRR